MFIFSVAVTVIVMTLKAKMSWLVKLSLILLMICIVLSIYFGTFIIIHPEAGDKSFLELVSYVLN
jgi:hypothetical protein